MAGRGLGESAAASGAVGVRGGPAGPRRRRRVRSRRLELPVGPRPVQGSESVRVTESGWLDLGVQVRLPDMTGITRSILSMFSRLGQVRIGCKFEP